MTAEILGNATFLAWVLGAFLWLAITVHRGRVR